MTRPNRRLGRILRRAPCTNLSLLSAMLCGSGLTTPSNDAVRHLQASSGTLGCPFFLPFARVFLRRDRTSLALTLRCICATVPPAAWIQERFGETFKIRGE